MLFTVVTPSPFPKPKSPNTPNVRKIKKRGEDLLVILSADVVAVGTYVDGSQGILGMVCL